MRPILCLDGIASFVNLAVLMEGVSVDKESSRSSIGSESLHLMIWSKESLKNPILRYVWSVHEENISQFIPVEVTNVESVVLIEYHSRYYLRLGAVCERFVNDRGEEVLLAVSEDPLLLIPRGVGAGGVPVDGSRIFVENGIRN